MAEYINREETKRELLEWCILLNSPHLLSRADTMFLLDNIPAADVAPVVRCKYCKYWHKETLFCDYMPYGNARERVNWYGDDFCSYGERKDGA